MLVLQPSAIYEAKGRCAQPSEQGATRKVSCAKMPEGLAQIRQESQVEEKNPAFSLS